MKITFVGARGSLLVIILCPVGLETRFPGDHMVIENIHSCDRFIHHVIDNSKISAYLTNVFLYPPTPFKPARLFDFALRTYGARSVRDPSSENTHFT
jgi:hypothetical protein